MIGTRLRSVVLIWSILYPVGSMLIGIVGDMFFAYSPSEANIKISKYVSVIFLLYYFPATYFLFTNKSNPKSIYAQFPSVWKRWAMLIFGVPLLVVVLTYAHYLMFSRSIPYVISRLLVPAEEKNLVVTDKWLSGKRDRTENVKLSGHGGALPVTRKYYNSVVVGKEVRVLVHESWYGVAVRF